MYLMQEDNKQMYNYENEMINNYENSNVFHSFEDKYIRKSFIRKVYSLLTLQLLFTFLVSFTFNSFNECKEFTKSESGQALLIISIIGILMIIITMFCNPDSVKSFPGNYIILSLFTIFMSYQIGVITIYYNTTSVMAAFAITSGITFSLTLFACQTKYDFTDKGGYLVAILTGLILTGIVNIFIQNSVLQTIISSIGAILFSCYIVYDTQLIVGGSHRKYKYDIDDYAFAALSLYLDIINLFLYILDLFNTRD